jgi:glyoxylase-like metal-dependent hydrolase (beta-lactamase superfamily II)
MLDTRLGGLPGITAAFLADGASPALVETGARTSAPALLEALAAAGVGADDLAWIVLTHVHLDHCGGTGLVARAFPRARVVVHRRGARHLVDPERLVAASAAVYGAHAGLYGGLDPTPEERVVAVGDGHRVPLGGGRDLVMVEAPGHARHHMAVLHEPSGSVLAGDALGVAFPGSGLHPAVPPPDFDLEAARATLRRLAELRPQRLCLAHFGPVADPLAAIALSERQQTIVAEAALAAWRREPTREAVAAAVAEALPLEATVREGPGLARWRSLAWAEANVDGLAVWAERAAADEAAPAQGG